MLTCFDAQRARELLSRKNLAERQIWKLIRVENRKADLPSVSCWSCCRASPPNYPIIFRCLPKPVPLPINLWTFKQYTSFEYLRIICLDSCFYRFFPTHLRTPLPHLRFNEQILSIHRSVRGPRRYARLAILYICRLYLPKTHNTEWWMTTCKLFFSRPPYAMNAQRLMSVIFRS